MTGMDLSTSVQGLLTSEKYSDIILKCNETVFKVHRAIICTKSTVLAAAFDGGFEEATTRQVDLSASELLVVTAMVKYLYSDNYDDNSSESNPIAEPAEPAEPEPAEPEPAEAEPAEAEPAEAEPAEVEPADAEPAEGDSQPIETTHPIVFNTKVYLIADQYHIPSLKRLAKTKYEKAVNQPYEPWSPSTFAAFNEATKLLWENTVQSDRLLRDFVVETAVMRMDTLLKEATFVSLMEKWGDLAVDVLKAKYLGTYESTEVADLWDFNPPKSKGRKGRNH